MEDKSFLNSYFNNLIKLLNFENQTEKLIQVKNAIIETKKKIIKQ